MNSIIIEEANELVDYIQVFCCCEDAQCGLRSASVIQRHLLDSTDVSYVERNAGPESILIIGKV